MLAEVVEVRRGFVVFDGGTLSVDGEAIAARRGDGSSTALWKEPHLRFLEI